MTGLQVQSRLKVQDHLEIATTTKNLILHDWILTRFQLELQHATKKKGEWDKTLFEHGIYRKQQLNWSMLFYSWSKKFKTKSVWKCVFLVIFCQVVTLSLCSDGRGKKSLPFWTRSGSWIGRVSHRKMIVWNSLNNPDGYGIKKRSWWRPKKPYSALSWWI